MSKLAKITINTSFIFLLTVSTGFAEKLKTKVTGGSMEIQKGGDVVIFRQGAKVKRGKNTLTCKKIIQFKKKDLIKAFGNIKFEAYTPDDEYITGRSQKAEYNNKLSKGKLWEGRPNINYYVKDSTDTVELTADEVFMDSIKDEIFARGSVEIITSSASTYSSRALFKQEDKTLFLDGRPQPKLIYIEDGKENIFNADEITLYLENKKIIMINDVTAKVITEDKN